jgi:aldehyde:ferredoxin oxidoreductase
MAAGTTAKILHVDLSTGETRAEMLPETVVRTYLGGGALAG